MFQGALNMSEQYVMNTQKLHSFLIAAVLST
jgi:hypothetical protein